MNTSSLTVYTVSQVNERVGAALAKDSVLRSIAVRGEISNYSQSPKGHRYFSLKDAQGVLQCVVWASTRLSFEPENGMQVLAFGAVVAYPAGGKYQLQCRTLVQEGRGSLDERYRRLFRRLEAEGLFDEAHKLPLPRYPRRIAVVTSPNGKAVWDIVRTLRSRWPMAEALVVPAIVQGEGAAEDIAAAIHRVNNRADIDLIITGRGGGSREELWAFNEEVVARAIYLSNIPVISAVGHEPDVSISDYVADQRAGNPTKAVIQAVPSREEEGARLAQLSHRLALALRRRLAAEKRELTRLKDSRVLRDIKAPIQDQRQLLESLRRRMGLALRGRTDKSRQALDARRSRLPLAVKARLTAQRGKLGRAAAGLDAMSPLKVLGRGYAIARRGEDVVSSIGQAQPGDRLDVLVSDGALRCEVKEKEERTWQ